MFISGLDLKSVLQDDFLRQSQPDSRTSFAARMKAVEKMIDIALRDRIAIIPDQKMLRITVDADVPPRISDRISEQVGHRTVQPLRIRQDAGRRQIQLKIDLLRCDDLLQRHQTIYQKFVDPK